MLRLKHSKIGEQKTRRSVSPEFKLEATQLAVDRGYSHHQLSTAMGVGFSTIGKYAKNRG